MSQHRAAEPHPHHGHKHHDHGACVDEAMARARALCEARSVQLTPIREKVLQAVVATRAGMVLVEVTGLAEVDERVASEVMRLVGCVRLLGSRAMLVGLSAEAARILAALDVNLDQVPSFTTLHDALRVVLGEGFEAAPRSRVARPARAR